MKNENKFSAGRAIENSTKIFLPCLLFVISGCGGGKDNFKSNPKSNYPQVEIGKPLTKEDANNYKGPTKYVEQEKPVYIQPQNPIPSILNVAGKNILNFVEGKSASYLFDVRIYTPGVTYALEGRDLPKGAKIEKEGASWKLTWNPSIGTVPANPNFVFGKLTLFVKILKSPDENIDALLKQADKQLEVTYFVERAETQATIESVSGLSETAVEGEQQTFTVIVNVPGSTKSDEPTLYFSFDGMNTLEKEDGLIQDGTHYLVVPFGLEKPEYLDSGRWRFTRKLDFSSLNPVLNKNTKKPISSEEFAKVKFTMVAFSNRNSRSDSQIKLLKVKFNIPSVPVIVAEGLKGGNGVAGKTGHKFSLAFEASAPNQHGTISVEVPEYEQLAGDKKSMKCTDKSSVKKNCTLTWTIPCSVIATTGEVVKQTLTLVAKNTVAGLTEEKSLPVELSIENDSKRCVAPKK